MAGAGVRPWRAWALAVALLGALTGCDSDRILWSGAITPTTAVIRIDMEGSGGTVYLWGDSSRKTVVQSTSLGAGIQKWELTGLTEGTKYWYGMDSDVGAFQTPRSGAFSYRVAFASCARTGYRSEVFRDVAKHNALFFIHMGDINYSDVSTDSLSDRAEAFEDVWKSSSQADMFRAQPTVYMWDDHDFGPNNADGTFVGTQAAREAYKLYVPHYPLAAGSGDEPVYQAFTIGRVRYLLTDLRSASALPASPTSTMGTAQKAWFFDELSKWRDYGLVVWVNTKPWQGPDDPGSDKWSGYTAERREIADHLVSIGITNFVTLAGDTHMVAIDDGSHTDFSTNGGGGFPLFQSAPLAQYGSAKSTGPYSEGCYGYKYYMNHQYGLMDIEDNGTEVCIKWNGFRHGVDEPLASWSKCTPLSNVKGTGGTGGCSLPWLPAWMWVVVVFVTVGTCAGPIACFVWRRRVRKVREGYTALTSSGRSAREVGVEMINPVFPTTASSEGSKASAPGGLAPVGPGSAPAHLGERSSKADLMVAHSGTRRSRGGSGDAKRGSPVSRRARLTKAATKRH